MSALKPYPHYEINVKDNSIYTFAVEEILPVHRPLWVLPTQEGPVGDPVWCATATQLKKKFGEQTLNLANQKYATPQSFYLNQTMSYDGAFIVRALPENAQYATAILVAEVTEAAEIDQYLIDEDLLSETYGQRLIDNDTDSETYGQYIKKIGEDGEVVTEPGVKILFKVRQATAAELTSGLDRLSPVKTASGSTEYPILAFKALYPGEYGNDLCFRFFYKESENSAPNAAYYKTIFNSLTVARREYNNTTTNIVYDIYGRGYNTFSADPDCVDPETGVQMDMDNVLTNSFDVESSTGTDFPYTVYTFEENLKTIGEKIIAAELAYNNGRSLAYEEFGYSSATEVLPYQINVLSGLNIKGVPYDHVAISGRCEVDPEITYTYTPAITTDGSAGDEGAGEPGTGSPTTNVEYQADTTYFVGTPDVNNPNTVKYTMLVEGIDYVVGDLISIEALAAKLGYQEDEVMVYTRSVVDNSADYDTQDERVVPDAEIDNFLVGGDDGDLQNATEQERDNFVDHFMYRFLKLHINPKIVDKFRYPMTHLYDPGYSMTTKYAMLDFLDTRDDVAVELSTQVLFPNKWATGFYKDITLNDQAKDIQDGLVLRERALLMRESVLKGTECMRASIYAQAGKPVAATYTKPVPFTFWSAMKHAEYGNTDQMSQQEPRGLPYSYNEMFKSWNWTNYSESMKEKTWNAGINYCQYADMTRIFYPALRTVYREETSVLVDQWVVDALVYTKHECRKAWARFSGRNDKQAVLESAIKNYLEEKLAYLYNGKYDFTLSVYKTEEEQKLGYVEHVKLKLVFPATMRVINFDIEVNREGYEVESEA